MALFQYFPNNYIWNLSVNIALESGGRIGEIEDMCRPLLDAAARGEDAGTGQFLAQWVSMADKLVGLAEEDEARGRAFSAGAKLQRASLYYITAERMQGHGHPGRAETFAKGQNAFRKGTALARENCTRVEIPFGDSFIPALFTKAEGVDGPAPCVLYVNGLDSCKELLFWSWLPHALAKRGISTLCIDQPGTGEALRANNLYATHETERWATPVFDYLAARPDVIADKIGMVGISLGGYFTPRAVAFEPRFASGAVWGANHDWREVQQKRLKREGENPVPHYWGHVRWVFGAQDMDDFLAKAEGMHLNGVLDRIKVPFLVTHGAKDRQIALDYAHQTYDQLVNSPRRELKIFTEREGGVEHVGADNMSFGRDYIADWFADTLGGRLG
ncbi:alpha/beta hydrolase [Niveispirillum sp. SYP-B3756]|uniref:alpha/beta hydrolase family protein n=1 Tax=Niveispirillum sp. SYP-B3756 TaxID=2662178 RepID=UPI00129299ED|nr:prolyl oligopeptidase family serine peptidase [Niveispirillum sp. SYP-B3756]MQP68254.1 alpha/beta hydrolase [Niveispirillum sp. SYP-B3756]